MKKIIIILLIIIITFFSWIKFWEHTNKTLFLEEITQEELFEESEKDNQVRNNPEYNRIFHWENYIQNYWVIKYRDEIIKNVDIDSFRYLTGSYGQDKNNYYFAWKIIYISDGIFDKWDIWIWKNFEILQWNYSKDENFFYYQDEWFLKHNNKNINFIPEKSENNYFEYFVKIWDEIYYWNHKLSDLDINTFSHLKYNYFKDKNWIYYWNNLLTLSKKYFEIIDENFIKDDRYVFLEWTYNSQLDAKSFKKLKIPDSHSYFWELYSDKNWFYSFNEYWHSFYKIKNNISQENIQKCLNNQDLCVNILWY